MFAEMDHNFGGILFCVCFLKHNHVKHRVGIQLGSTIIEHILGLEDHIFVAYS